MHVVVLMTSDDRRARCARSNLLITMTGFDPGRLRSLELVADIAMRPVA